MKNLVIFACLLLAGCGRVTVQDFCRDVAEPMCRRASQCGDASKAVCLEIFSDFCCIGDNCQREMVDPPRELMSKCLDAATALTCSEIALGTVPAECRLVSM